MEQHECEKKFICNHTHKQSTPVYSWVIKSSGRVKRGKVYKIDQINISKW